MADAILRVITSPQRQSELRALGIGQLALYTRQQMARATLGVYRQLMTL
jgi:hypothetical protein